MEQTHDTRRNMEQKHGAETWSRNMVQAGASSKQQHGAEAWSMQNHGPSTNMEEAEAWSK
jgi:hypothetical protein